MAHPAIVEQRNQEATLYVGDLDQQVTEALLWELMLQSGPVVSVHIPKDKLSGTHSGYGFVEFNSEDDADYAIKVMNMIKLYGRPIKVNKASQGHKTMDVGANIFVGNLDPDVDEKMLYDTFSSFGVIISTPKIMRESDTGVSKGFGFVNFDTFEASDASVQQMNGQYLSGRPISVSYALKKESKSDRHGDFAERIIAANNPTKRAGAFFALPNTPHGVASPAPPAFVPPPPMIYPPPMPPMMGMPMGMQGMQGMPPMYGAPYYSQ